MAYLASRALSLYLLTSTHASIVQAAAPADVDAEACAEPELRSSALARTLLQVKSDTPEEALMDVRRVVSEPIEFDTDSLLGEKLEQDASISEQGADATEIVTADESLDNTLLVRLKRLCGEARCGHIEFIGDQPNRSCIGKEKSKHGGLGADVVLRKNKSCDCLTFALPSSGKGPIVDLSRTPPLCLTIDHGFTGDGAHVVFKPCRGDFSKDLFTSFPDQTWLVPTAASGPVRLSEFPNKCLNSVNGTSQPGTRVQLWTCGDGDHPNEQFSFPSFGS